MDCKLKNKFLGFFVSAAVCAAPLYAMSEDDDSDDEGNRYHIHANNNSDDSDDEDSDDSDDSSDENSQEKQAKLRDAERKIFASQALEKGKNFLENDNYEEAINCYFEAEKINKEFETYKFWEIPQTRDFLNLILYTLFQNGDPLYKKIDRNGVLLKDAQYNMNRDILENLAHEWLHLKKSEGTSEKKEKPSSENQNYTNIPKEFIELKNGTKIKNPTHILNLPNVLTNKIASYLDDNDLDSVNKTKLQKKTLGVTKQQVIHDLIEKNASLFDLNGIISFSLDPHYSKDLKLYREKGNLGSLQENLIKKNWEPVFNKVIENTERLIEAGAIYYIANKTSLATELFRACDGKVYNRIINTCIDKLLQKKDPIILGLKNTLPMLFSAVNTASEPHKREDYLRDVLILWADNTFEKASKIEINKWEDENGTEDIEGFHHHMHTKMNHSY